jgi:hypothetical protein
LRSHRISGALLRAIADLLFASLVFAAVFVVHARWIYTHFSSDGYLLDSGWLAYLFASADPLLHNPSGINQLSFYAHHASPHIFLFGAPLSRLSGLNGITIFAYHQGVFFSLFFLSLYLIVASADLSWPYRIVGGLVAVAVGALSNALFQAAAYPHFEIAMTALSSLALAAYLSGHRRFFVVCLLWLPLIREDGGLYSAFVCLACIAVEYGPRTRFDERTLRLLTLAAIGLIASACSSLLKARFFPGFDAFASNFSGHSWDHLSVGFMTERLQAMIGNMTIAPVLVGCLLLALFDTRYLAGLVLLSPLFLLHLASVHTEHGHFTLYYALPWLLPCTLWLAVFVRRAKSAAASAAESVLVVILSLAITAPLQAAVGVRGQFWYVAKWAVTRPVVDIEGMKEYALWIRRSFGVETDDRGPKQKNCVSIGIAALIPNDVTPNDVLNVSDDLSTCHTLLLMRGDMQYGPLRARAEAEHFEHVASQYNAEVWLIRTAPAEHR